MKLIGFRGGWRGGFYLTIPGVIVVIIFYWLFIYKRPPKEVYAVAGKWSVVNSKVQTTFYFGKNLRFMQTQYFINKYVEKTGYYTEKLHNKMAMQKDTIEAITDRGDTILFHTITSVNKQQIELLNIKNNETVLLTVNKN